MNRKRGRTGEGEPAKEDDDGSEATMEARRIDGSEANRRKRGESTEARRIDGSEANRWKRGESTEARRIDGSEANRWKRGESMEARRIAFAKCHHLSLS